MKKIISLIVFSFIFSTSQAQSTKGRTALGVAISGIGDNTAFHLTSLDGGGSYSGKGYYSLAITYLRSLPNKFDLETGIEYGKNSYHFENSSVGPDVDASHNAYLSLIEIPITVRFNLSQYFFVNGGLLLDFDVTKEKQLDNQTGMGTILGAGAKYDFKSTPIGLFINPFLKYRPLIPFTSKKYHLRTREIGFRIGAVYLF